MDFILDGRAKRQDAAFSVGNDVAIRAAVRLGGVPVDWTDPTITPTAKLWNAALGSDPGTPFNKKYVADTLAAEQFDLDISEAGKITLALTDTQTTTLGAGIWVYAFDIDVNGFKRTYLHGLFVLVDPKELS